MSVGKITISKPKAKYGDTVLVLNYRKTPKVWQEGEVRGVAYKSGFGERFSWVYDIYIDTGKGYFIYVGDEAIKEPK